MAYSIDSSSDSCYEGTTCLINKLGIQDEALLSQTESAYTLAKVSYLELHPLSGNFDFSFVNPDDFIIATIYAAQGVTDDLANIFSELIEPPKEPDMGLIF